MFEDHCDKPDSKSVNNIVTLFAYEYSVPLLLQEAAAALAKVVVPG
jgi:hypothetical protein